MRFRFYPQRNLVTVTLRFPRLVAFEGGAPGGDGNILRIDYIFWTTPLAAVYWQGNTFD